MIRPILLASLLWSCGPDETISGYSDPEITWGLVEVNAAAFPSQAWLRFPTEGVVLGAGPCNSFTARQGAPLPWIEITNVTLTERACPDLRLERVFLDSLRAASLAEPGSNVLLLTNDDGLEMVFHPIQLSDDPA